MAKFGWCKTEKVFLNWLRSAMRRVWVKHPVRLQMLQDARFKAPSPSGRMIFQVRCAHCNKVHKMDDVEVNHKEQVGKDLSFDNFGEYCYNLLVVSPEDLEILCKPCHSIVTYSERSGMSMRDAAIEKKVIKFKSKTADQQKAGLTKLGIVPAKTITLRCNQAREYLRTIM